MPGVLCSTGAGQGAGKEQALAWEHVSIQPGQPRLRFPVHEFTARLTSDHFIPLPQSQMVFPVVLSTVCPSGMEILLTPCPTGRRRSSA